MAYQASQLHEIDAEKGGDLEVNVSGNGSSSTYVKIGVVLASAAVVATLGVATYNGMSTTTTSASVAALSSGFTKYSTQSEDNKKELFETFKTNFAPTYKDFNEETLRYSYFRDSLLLIDKLNEEEIARGGSATFGITKFSDRSVTERKNLHKSTSPTEEERAKTKVADPVITDRNAASTETVNWAGIYTTPVKDQGYCGSCWAFSASEQIESDSIRNGLLTVDDWLSPQQLVSCDTYLYGCDGGDTPYAYYYVYEVGGIETNASYPYTSYWDVTGTCEANSKDFVVTVTDYSLVSGEQAMADYVSTTGPLSVCLHADDAWYYYDGGVMSNCGMDVNHCVQAVGINYEENYWVVRNSWGTDWGLSGYIYLNLWNNTCNIADYPTYVTPSLV